MSRIASRPEKSRGGGGVLPYISAYHQLAAAIPRRVAHSRAKAMKKQLLDILEPKRVTHHGYRRIPVTFHLALRAHICTPDGTIECRVRSITLRDVVMEMDSVPPFGSEVTFEIEGTVTNVWWRFQGVALRGKRGRQVVVRIAGASASGYDNLPLEAAE